VIAGVTFIDGGHDGSRFGLVYAVAMLAVMVSKDVSAAFAGRPIRRPVDSDRELDDEWRE
jgi:hypothetical protein